MTAHLALFLATLAAPAALAAPPPPAAAAAATIAELPPDQERDWNAPPPGAAPADEALWVALRDAGNEAVLHMGRVFQAAFRLRYGQYHEALEAAEKGGLPDASLRAVRARARLDAATRAADDAIPKKGLRVRTCKYVLMDLDTRLGVDDPAAAADLPAVREEARACAEEVAAFARRLAPRADELEAALVEADAAAGRAAPVLPPEVQAAAQAAADQEARR